MITIAKPYNVIFSITFVDGSAYTKAFVVTSYSIADARGQTFKFISKQFADKIALDLVTGIQINSVEEVK